MSMPKRVRERLAQGLRAFQPIIQQQVARDPSEADTVTLVKDIYSELFGYDKYAELTSEHAIRGTKCDLAVKIDEHLCQLAEVKAAGVSLDDKHVKQAVDYASNEGCEWVVLTNGVHWRLYQVQFKKPVDKKLVIDVDLLTLDARKDDDLEKLWPLTKEGFQKGAHVEMRDMQEATSRHLIAALLVENESVVGAVRRELRRLVEVKVEDESIRRVLRDEIIKRDILEGQEWKDAVHRVNRGETKSMRRTDAAPAPETPPAPVAPPQVQSGA